MSAQLKQEDAAAVREANRLAAYIQFQTLHEQRLATISSLADSRFDWERVMHELALVLPHDVWLTDLSASASSTDGGATGDSGSLRSAIPGPALSLTGCATGQEAVARFVTALKDIDGVTRVGVESSELPDEEEGAPAAKAAKVKRWRRNEGGSGECQTRDFIASFSLVVAFDAAPIPVTGGVEGEAPASRDRNRSEHRIRIRIERILGRRRMTANNKIIVAMVAVVALAVVFWMMLLSPKREEVRNSTVRWPSKKNRCRCTRPKCSAACRRGRAFPRSTSNWSCSARPRRPKTTPLRCWFSSTALPEDASVRFQTFELESAGSAEESAEARSAGRRRTPGLADRGRRFDDASGGVNRPRWPRRDAL